MNSFPQPSHFLVLRCLITLCDALLQNTVLTVFLVYVHLVFS
jgi:hypothetical protein